MHQRGYLGTAKEGCTLSVSTPFLVLQSVYSGCPLCLPSARNLAGLCGRGEVCWVRDVAWIPDCSVMQTWHTLAPRSGALGNTCP